METQIFNTEEQIKMSKEKIEFAKTEKQEVQ